MFTTVEAYDPATDKWSAAASMPTPRSFPASATVNGTLFVIGGEGALANGLFPTTGVTEAFGPPAHFTAFLHGTGATANPATLFLDQTAPSGSTAKYRDSTGVSFSGGNIWKDIGFWAATPAISAGTLSQLGPFQSWIGLKNSDDQGTRFDVRVEVFKNSSLISAGETHCIQGVTRNPSNALPVAVSFGSFPPVSFNATSDQLSLRILTRIGTNSAGGFCGGHNNATGLRLYFDSAAQASALSATR